MQELLLQLIDRIRGTWRFRWWGVAAAWVVCVLGWTFVLYLPNKFEATARVYVDTQGALRPLLKGLTVDSNVGSNIALVRQAILSRPQLEEVARATGLDPGARTAEQMDLVVQKLNKNLLLSKESRGDDADGVYRISYQWTDRKKALLVVQTLLNSFVEDTLLGKRTGQEGAQKFLVSQISDYEQRLAASEQRLAEFKKRNVGTMPDEKGDYFGRMQGEMTALTDARGQLSMAMARREELTRQVAGEDPFIFGFDTDSTRGGDGPAVGGDVAMRIADLEHKREELLLRFTEKHPEVISLDRTLADLRARQSAELARLRSGQHATGDLANSAKSNPVFQNLQVELKRAEVAVAELRQSVAQHEGKVAELRRLVDTVPETEAELSRLNRDYEVTRAQYKELLQRLETAKLSDQADRTGTVKFQIIDPPASPVDPVAPNKALLLGFFLLAGCAIGLALAVLLNELEPVFHNTKALARLAGARILGSVSRSHSHARDALERRQLWRFSAAVGLLLLAFAVAFSVTVYLPNLVQRIKG